MYLPPHLQLDIEPTYSKMKNMVKFYPNIEHLRVYDGTLIVKYHNKKYVLHH